VEGILHLKSGQEDKLQVESCCGTAGLVGSTVMAARLSVEEVAAAVASASGAL